MSFEVVGKGSLVRACDLVIGDEFWAFTGNPCVLVGKFHDRWMATGEVGLLVVSGNGETYRIMAPAAKMYDRVIVIPKTPVIEAELITALAARGIEF